MRINPLEFHRSIVDKDPIEFLAEDYRTIAVIGVPSEDKVELLSYQLKGIEKVSYDNGLMKEVRNQAKSVGKSSKMHF